MTTDRYTNSTEKFLKKSNTYLFFDSLDSQERRELKNSFNNLKQRASQKIASDFKNWTHKKKMHKNIEIVKFVKIVIW